MLQNILNAFTLPYAQLEAIQRWLTLIHTYTRFSGVLAARFMLHLRAYNDRMHTIVSDNNGNLDPYRETHVSTFRAVGRAVASTVDDFGHDPMVYQRAVQADVQGSSEDASNENIDG